jgi:dihydrolipoamide dehydrogenase
MQEFDLLVIGAGPAGYVGAVRAAQLGARVCLVEKAEVGGVCMNRGCIPTKSLVAFAELYEKTKSAAALGVRVDGQVTADLSAAVQRKREVVAMLVKGVRNLLARRGVTLVSGEASFVNERTVEVVGARVAAGAAGTAGAVGTPGAAGAAGTAAGPERLSAKKILIATGSETAELPGLPFDGSRVLSSTEALELETIPRSMLIVGAGAIGCEFAFIFSALGTCVTVVEALDRALPTEDRDVSAVMERELRKRKIDLVTQDSVASCVVSPASVKSTLRSGSELETERVLVSVGRRFTTAGLSLDRAGVKCGPRGEVQTDEYMETISSGIYAAGDVVGQRMYAHSASREAIVAVENALMGESARGGTSGPGGSAGRKTMDYSAVPACTFTRPEVGSVGLTEAQAVERGLKVNVGRFNFRALGRAQVLGEIAGMVKVVADAATDVVLGVHIIGPHATELVHEGVLAVSQRLTARTLSETIHAHPTFSEAVMEAAEGVHGLSIHSPA